MKAYDFYQAETHETFTKLGKICHSPIETMCALKRAWNEINHSIIQKSFKKCHIYKNIDDVGNDYLRMDNINNYNKN